MKNIIIPLLCIISIYSNCLAKAKIPAIFSSGMVLQRNVPIKIWGWAAPEEKVKVQLGKSTITTYASKEGEWETTFAPLKSGNSLTLTIKAENIITINDILVGDVWLCSGQSNMHFSVQRAANAENEISLANYPDIRLFKVSKAFSDKPLSDIQATWTKCNPDTIKDFSAVAYYFGRKIHKEQQVPVALIQSSWGGTPAEAWMSTAKLKNEFQTILKKWEQGQQNVLQIKKNYEINMKAWQKQRKLSREKKQPEPPRPVKPNELRPHRHPTKLYNAMINPLIKFPIKGIIWYQGESNVRRAKEYRTLFPALIEDWRTNWRNDNLPFIFVQLANYGESQLRPCESNWAELREAQLMTLKLENTGMAVTIDIGEANDIHPKNKQEVGRRLALIALAKVYGQQLMYSGPIYKSMKIEENKIRLFFNHTDQKLICKGTELKGYIIAGKDRNFISAKAKIIGDSIIVYHKKISSPIAVRYAWADNPTDCNLYNNANLPASPFRTDNWPEITK